MNKNSINQFCLLRVTNNPVPLRFQILVMLVFEERGKSENPEKKPLTTKDENQQQTQPTYTVPLKRKLPVSSRFSRDESRVSRCKLDFVRNRVHDW